MIKKILFLASALGLSAVAASGLPFGRWAGNLSIGANKLRIVFNLTQKGDSTLFTLDSPDQGAFGIPGTVGFLSSDSVSLTISSIGASFQGSVSADGRMAGSFRQGFANLPLSLEKVAMNRPQTPVAPFPYSVSEVCFINPSDSEVLAGTLTVPDNANSSTKVVIMVTGSGLQNRDEELFGHKPFAVIADYLARQGIASLRYDDRGCGQSTGEGKNASATDFAEDALAAINYVRSLGRFEKCGILGHSEGGSIAFRLGARVVPDFIIGIAAPLCPAPPLLGYQSEIALRHSGTPNEAVQKYGEVLQGLYPVKIKDGNIKAGEYVEEATADWPAEPLYQGLKQNLLRVAFTSSPWFDEFIAYQPADDLKSVKCPIALVYGERDTQVPPQLMRPYFDTCASTAQIKVFPSLNHMMQHAQNGSIEEYSEIEETMAPEVLSFISDFVLSL